MHTLPALRAGALALACVLAPAAHANGTIELLTGIPRLACEAPLCLSSSLRPGECSPSLDHYFDIKKYNKRSLEEATAAAQRLIDQGIDFDVGLGQINVRNWAWLKLDATTVFDPCRNLTAAQTVLAECYTRALPTHKDPQQALHDTLSPHDRHGLLIAADAAPGAEIPVSSPAAVRAASEPSGAATDISKPSLDAEEVTSLDDIFASAEFSELDLGDDSIFDIRHVPAVSDREQPDEIAQRTVCHDFYEFEHIFRDLHEGLKNGSIQTTRFQQSSKVQEGDAFIMEGVLCLIDKIGEYRLDSTGRYDPRLRIIFENSTESNHLLQSLAKRLFADETGRRIVCDAESVVDAFNNISHRDKRAGQIYFVSSLSDNPTLKAIPNLIKIGYTEQTVEERTKNATRGIAFLEAPVKILASIECYNLNPNKFETLIHGFLHAQRLTMTLTGRDGKAYNPGEWFSVPLNTAREVVRRIIDGSIVQYRMDNTTNRLVKKRSTDEPA